MSRSKKNLITCTRWFSGAEHPLDSCLSAADENGLKFIIARDYKTENMCKPSKMYKAYRNYKSYLDIIIKGDLGEPDYEIVRGGVPCRLFADVEWPLSFKSKEEVRNKIHEVVDSVLEELKVETRWDDGMRELDASRQEIDKGSLHFVHPGLVFESVEEQLKFWNRVYAKFESEKVDGKSKWEYLDETKKNYVIKLPIDFTVYNKNRNFRMIGCYKMDKDGGLQRQLLPPVDVEIKVTVEFCSNYCITVLSGEEEQVDTSVLDSEIVCTQKEMWSIDLLKGLIDKHALHVTINSLQGNLVILRNKRGARVCPISGNTHESNSPYLVIKGRKLYYGCHGAECKGKPKLLHTLEAQTRPFQPHIPLDDYLSDYHRNVLPKNTVAAWQNWQSRVRDDMNRYCCVINGKAKAYVLYRQTFIEDELNLKYVCWMDKFFKNFEEAFGHFKVAPLVERGEEIVRGNEVLIVKLWLNWPGRRTFVEEDCCPIRSRPRPEVFNTFQSLCISEEMALQRDRSAKHEDDLQNWLKFIKEAWCGDDEELFEYVMNWWAHLVQKPGVKMISCLVLRGGEGYGKGMIVQTIGKILGTHTWLQPLNHDHIFGQFNYLLHGKMFVFMDEMVWGGNKKDEGPLKKLLTEARMTTNQKFGPLRDVTNNINWIFASNKDWVIPAGKDARRFVVMDVKNTLHGMTKAEKNRLRCISPFVVARYLYNRDVSEFDSSEIVRTEALLEQKMLSMKPLHKWWCSLISRDGDHIGPNPNYNIEFGKVVGKETLYQDYKHNVERSVMEELFWREMKTMHPFEGTRPRENGSRVQKVCMPTLNEAKEVMNELYQQEIFPIVSEEELQ